MENIAQYYKEKKGRPNTKHLDVGCGSRARNPFECSELYGIDIIEQEEVDFQYRKCNVLLENLPFGNATFDSVSCYDFLEHIPRIALDAQGARFPFLIFMDEVYRVLKPGGVFYAITPYFPRHEAFVDPTHVNFITADTHRYFTSPDYGAAVYGFSGKFRAVSVKKTKLSWANKELEGPVSLIDCLYQAIAVTKKSHLLWVFESQ
jgi:SAM-dependent methyltransferase